MTDEHEQHEQQIPERMELGHEAVPGYRPVFYVALVIGILYLAILFVFCAGGSH